MNIDEYIAQCEYGKVLSSKPINVTIEDLGNEINSPFAEYAAVVTADGKNIYFTSRRPETTGGQLDYILDVFSQRLKIENIDFLDWIKQEYNADILNSSFKSRIEWKTAAIDLMEFSNAKNKR